MLNPYYYDPTFLLLIPALALALWAQYKVKSAYAKYAKVKVEKVSSAADLARALLDSAGAENIPIEKIPGQLTDHYDPLKKVLRLSQGVYESNSVAALGIAAHEVGHVLQHQKAYWPLMVRNRFFPAANIGSTLAFPLFVLGFFFAIPILMNIGILIFTFAVAFQVITLPVEFDASGKALQLLEKGRYLDAQGLQGAKAVLSAAALTYIAATAMAVLQLIRLLILRDRRD